MNEEPEVLEEPAEEAVVGAIRVTTCEHEWARAQDDPNSELESYQCTACWSGCSKAKETK